MKRGYDKKSEELARYFMADGEDVPESEIAVLAQHIQDAIENWFVGWNPVTRKHSLKPGPRSRRDDDENHSCDEKR